MADSSVKVVFIGDAKQLKRELSSIDDDTAKTSKGLTAGGVAMAAGFAAAAAGAIAFGRASFNAYEESRKVAAQTEAVIRSTGGAAHVTAGEIGDLADAISRKSGIDDEAIQSGENLLLTFTNIQNKAGAGNDIFNQATTALVDMSVAMGGDASSSAIQLGKALNDPAEGLKALTRVGVTFSDAQKEQIKTMQEAGDMAGAQKVILAELTKEFGGSAEAQATAADKMKVAFGNFQEQVGEKLTVAFEKTLTVAQGAVEQFDKLNDATGGAAGKVAVLGAGIGAASIALAKIGDMAVSAAKGMAALASSTQRTLIAMGPFVAIAGLVAGAVYGISHAEKLSVDTTKLFEMSTEDAVAVLIKMNRVAGTDTVAAFKQMAGASEALSQQIIDGMKAAGQDTTKFAEALSQVHVAHQRVAEGAQRMAAAEEATAAQVATAKKEAEAYTKVLEAHTKAVGLLADIYGPTGAKAIEMAGLSTEAMTNMAHDVDALNKATATAAGSIISSFDKVPEGAKNAREALRVSMYDQLKDTAAWADGIHKLIAAGVDQGLVEELAQAGPKAAPKVAAMLDLVKQIGVGAVNGAADAQRKIIADLNYDLDLMLAKAWTNSKLIAELTKQATDAGNLFGTAPSAPVFVPGHAAGGFASGWAIVGEKGPELANFGGGGAQIYSNADSQRMLGGGGGTVIQITNYITAPDRQTGDYAAQSVAASVRRELAVSLRGSVA